MQCNPPVSAVRHCRRLLHQKIQGSYLKQKSSHKAAILQESLEVQELHRKKFVILCVNFDQLTAILVIEKLSITKREKKSFKFKLLKI